MCRVDTGSHIHEDEAWKNKSGVSFNIVIIEEVELLDMPSRFNLGIKNWLVCIKVMQTLRVQCEKNKP